MKNPRTRIQGRRSTDSALAAIREDERVHISRELHDDLGQLLATLRLELTLMKRLPPGSPEAEARMASMDSLLLTAIGSLRRIAGNLRPRALEEGGLYFALESLRREFEKRHGIRCALEAQPDALELDERHSTAIYRLVQESLTNIARHAGASAAQISLRRDDAELSIDIQDDGRGIAKGDMAKVNTLGLLGMRERVAALQGSISVDGSASPGRGTRVAIRIPLPGGS
ncbi:sensor histidine kinase [Pseudoduganella violaceinigra]|uniref:sensor histidine kinase n=1 Tax=Pseudoduganella violaceinigra TaxID=246602 RepID=UPI0003FCF436|nr:sensor histidine kinase [Pseudoduganella violaceinigra]